MVDVKCMFVYFVLSMEGMRKKVDIENKTGLLKSFFPLSSSISLSLSLSLTPPIPETCVHVTPKRFPLTALPSPIEPKPFTDWRIIE